MSDPDIRRALDILTHCRAVSLPLAELARRVGTLDPATLAERLTADPRFLVLDTPGLPDPALTGRQASTDYRRALEAAGLDDTRRVTLTRPWEPPPADASGHLDPDDVREILRRTTARLLDPGPGGAALAAVAERVSRAMEAALNEVA